MESAKLVYATVCELQGWIPIDMPHEPRKADTRVIALGITAEVPQPATCDSWNVMVNEPPILV